MSYGKKLTFNIDNNIQVSFTQLNTPGETAQVKLPETDLFRIKPRLRFIYFLISALKMQKQKTCQMCSHRDRNM